MSGIHLTDYARRILDKQECQTAPAAALVPVETGAAALARFIDTPPHRRSLMPLEGVAWSLYTTHKAIAALIDDGKLVAFNVARAASKKAAVVVWARSLVTYLAAQKTAAIQIDAILADVLPGVQPGIRQCSLALILTVTTDHVTHLVSDGSLNLAPGQSRNLGRGQSPEIARSSIENFLKSRCIS